MQQVNFLNIGSIDYKSCWLYQEELMQKVIAQKLLNRDGVNNEKKPALHFLLFCEHPHVYTLGKSGLQKNLLISEEKLKALDAQFFAINRGGDITYHGPGQVVGYPIIDLDLFFNDVHKYMRLLEEIVIRTLKHYDIEADRWPGVTGVWLDAGKPDARKICAMGVRLSRWVTMHGFALNVNTDLTYFNHIVPCGISDKAVTSIQNELGYAVDTDEVQRLLKNNFEQTFNCQLV